jgi:hypothetical protein
LNKVRTISSNNNTSDETLERRIVMATEGVRTRFIGLTLKDRRRLSAENALTVSEYMILMKREINPRLTYIRYTVQFLSELSRRKLIEAQTGADLPGVDPKQLASQELSLSTYQVVDVKKKNAELENEIMVKILEKLAAI